MHFYADTKDGIEARHFVEMSSRPGELRPTRITDARKWWKNGEVVMPSVTTVLGVLNKYGLNNWRIDQHLQAAWKIKDAPDVVSPDDWIAEAKRVAELEMDKAPSAGTDFHDKLERFLLGELPDDDPETPVCEKAFETVIDETGIAWDDWMPEARFVSQHGYGGMVDLHTTGLNGAAGDPWVVDWKTKRDSSKWKPGKMAWPEHSQQLAAYREGLNIPDARCANGFINLETGEIDFHEHSEDELQKGWRIFSHALAIWQEQNGWPAEQVAA